MSPCVTQSSSVNVLYPIRAIVGQSLVVLYTSYVLIFYHSAIIIDSGTVVMHCKALNEEDFVTWLDVLRPFIVDTLQASRRISPSELRRTPTHRRSASVQDPTTFGHIDSVDKVLPLSHVLLIG